MERKAVHNLYIVIGAGAGAFGLLAFLVTLGSSLVAAWTAHMRAARAGRHDAVLATTCVFMALVVVATLGLQFDLQFEKFTWLLVGASLALSYWSLDPERAPPASSLHHDI